jgi:hypothetical protein
MKYFIQYLEGYLRHDFYKNDNYWTNDMQDAGQFTELEAELITKRFFKDIKIKLMPVGEDAKLFNLD